jgi:hypothetical protein
MTARPFRNQRNAGGHSSLDFCHGLLGERHSPPHEEGGVVAFGSMLCERRYKKGRPYCGRLLRENSLNNCFNVDALNTHKGES